MCDGCLKREETGWFSVATTVSYDDCCIITDFSETTFLSITSGEAVIFKVVNLMSCSKMGAET